MGKLRSPSPEWERLEKSNGWRRVRPEGTYYVRSGVAPNRHHGVGVTWRAYLGDEWLRGKDGRLLIAASGPYLMIAVDDLIDGKR